MSRKLDLNDDPHPQMQMNYIQHILDKTTNEINQHIHHPDIEDGNFK